MTPNWYEYSVFCTFLISSPPSAAFCSLWSVGPYQPPAASISSLNTTSNLGTICSYFKEDKKLVRQRQAMAGKPWCCVEHKRFYRLPVSDMNILCSEPRQKQEESIAMSEHRQKQKTTSKQPIPGKMIKHPPIWAKTNGYFFTNYS